MSSKEDILKRIQSRPAASTSIDGRALIQRARQARAEVEAAYEWAIQDLIPGGTLAQALPGYQYRPAQVEMSRLVGKAITHNTNLLTEAPTGVGKSLGYLIPIVRSGKKAVVSTANKALQDQLIDKDIPFIQRYVQDFEAAVLKGRNNYVCLDRLDKAAREEKGDAWDEDFTRLSGIVREDESFNGDFEKLPFSIHPELKSRVEGDREQCAWTQCPFHMNGTCYIKKMREQVQSAQVIVTNHTLLVLDAITEKILPAHDVVALDEAHHLEQEATRALTTEIKPTRITSLLRLKQVKKHTRDETYAAVEMQFARVWNLLETTLARKSKNASGVTLNRPIEEGLRLSSLIATLADEMDTPEHKAALTDKELTLYDQTVNRARNLASDLRNVFSVAQAGTHVYHIEQEIERNLTVYVAMTPLDVSGFLKASLFDKSTVICASATLAIQKTTKEGVEHDFSFFRQQVGASHPDTIERILPAVFDYRRNALLYVPTRPFPEPAYGDTPEAYRYEKAIGQEMLRLVRASGGRAFLLFTSKRMLNTVYEQIAADIPYPVLKQGDVSRPELVRRFKSAGNAVLFGTKSFWEGVDISGNALSLVVIDKLPFNAPEDPVLQARIEQLKATGGEWAGFSQYILPQVILQLKQGVGRLIRSSSDSGVMAILDTRLRTKRYGKEVLEALPPAVQTAYLKDVETFFQERAGN